MTFALYNPTLSRDKEDRAQDNVLYFFPAAPTVPLRDQVNHVGRLIGLGGLAARFTDYPIKEVVTSSFLTVLYNPGKSDLWLAATIDYAAQSRWGSSSTSPIRGGHDGGGGGRGAGSNRTGSFFGSSSTASHGHIADTEQQGSDDAEDDSATTGAAAQLTRAQLPQAWVAATVRSLLTAFWNTCDVYLGDEAFCAPLKPRFRQLCHAFATKVLAPFWLRCQGGRVPHEALASFFAPEVMNGNGMNGNDGADTNASGGRVGPSTLLASLKTAVGTRSVLSAWFPHVFYQAPLILSEAVRLSTTLSPPFGVEHGCVLLSGDLLVYSSLADDFTTALCFLRFLLGPAVLQTFTARRGVHESTCNVSIYDGTTSSTSSGTYHRSGTTIAEGANASDASQLKSSGSTTFGAMSARMFGLGSPTAPPSPGGEAAQPLGSFRTTATAEDANHHATTSPMVTTMLVYAPYGEVTLSSATLSRCRKFCEQLRLHLDQTKLLSPGRSTVVTASRKCILFATVKALYLRAGASAQVALESGFKGALASHSLLLRTLAAGLPVCAPLRHPQPPELDHHAGGGGGAAYHGALQAVAGCGEGGGATTDPATPRRTRFHRQWTSGGGLSGDAGGGIMRGPATAPLGGMQTGGRMRAGAGGGGGSSTVTSDAKSDSDPSLSTADPSTSTIGGGLGPLSSPYDDLLSGCFSTEDGSEELLLKCDGGWAAYRSVRGRVGVIVYPHAAASLAPVVVGPVSSTQRNAHSATAADAFSSSTSYPSSVASGGNHGRPSSPRPLTTTSISSGNHNRTSQQQQRRLFYLQDVIGDLINVSAELFCDFPFDNTWPSSSPQQ